MKDPINGTFSSLNSPFDPRIIGVGAGHRRGMNRPLKGYIQHASSAAAAFGGMPRRVNFLFNPQSLQVSHPISTSFFSQSSMQGDATAQGLDNLSYAQLGSNLGSTSLSLYFDRTYEVNTPSALNKDGVPFPAVGVYDDVVAFYKFLGMISVNVTVDGSPIAGITDQYGDGNIYGYADAAFPGLTPGPVMSYIYMGPIRFYGAITELDITYTHWTPSLVPFRAVINVGFTIYNQATSQPILPKTVDSFSTKADDASNTISPSQFFQQGTNSPFPRFPSLPGGGQ